MRAWIPASLVLLAAAALAPPAAAQDDRAAVMAVVTGVFDGMRARDTALMRSLFSPHARMIGWDTRQNPPLQVLDPAGWIASVARGQGPGPDERLFDPVVHVDDHIAQVWVYYELWIGTRLNHCGYDAFFLVKMPDGWKINQVADTRRMECEARR
jgi:hypothetical protein